MNIIYDPNKQHKTLTNNEILEHTGLIPWWFLTFEAQTQTAEEVIDTNYIVPFSQHLMKDFDVTENHTLQYPDDSDLHPYLQFDHQESIVRIYPYGITSITTDGNTKISRLD